jgi:hypothetical protein
MSHAVTNRLYLPAGQKVYCSDDVHGDERIRELYHRHGDLNVEACNKQAGMMLDDLPAFWKGTIEEFWA